MKNIAIYSRKSRFTSNGESIENQIEFCRNYIKLNLINYNDIVVYEDEGFSGADTKRPNFKKMINDIETGLISAIIVYRIDRISRNTGDFVKLLEYLKSMDISFISIKEQFDTYSPMGRAMLYIASVFSQLERETIAERIKDNLNELSKTGRWLGGITPTGYKSECIYDFDSRGKLKKRYKLSILNDEANVVNLIFNKFLETDSIKITQEFLYNEGYKTKNNKYFSRFTIKNILSNPVYIIADYNIYNFFEKNNIKVFSNKSNFNSKNGIIAYNRTIQKKGKTHKFRKINDWIISIGEHYGIIDSNIWIEVYNKLERNKKRKL